MIITFSNAETGPIMGYLKIRHNSRLAFDPSYPNRDHCIFGNMIVQISMRVQLKLSHPMLRGKEVDLCMFADSWQHKG